MKLVVAVVKNEDAEVLVDSLIRGHHRATKLASTGSFLGIGSTTFLVGAEESAVDEVMSIIRKCCLTREKYVTQGTYEFVAMGVQRPVEVSVGGATIFVLNVVQFGQFCRLA